MTGDRVWAVIRIGDILPTVVGFYAGEAAAREAAEDEDGFAVVERGSVA